MFSKFQKVISFAIGFILILLLVLIFSRSMNAYGSIFSNSAVDYSRGWVDESGSEVSLSGISAAPDSTVTFYKTIDLSQLNVENLCFVSQNIVFSIYAGDRLIYDFHPTLGGFWGKRYGDYVHTVPLPRGSEKETLTITGTIIYSNNWTGFEKMVLQDSGAFISGMITDNAGNFVICLLIFVFGLFLLVMGTIETVMHTDMPEPIYLGVITMLLSLWTNTNTKILHVITRHSSALRIIDYVVVCLLPIPVMMFVASFTRSQNNKALKACICLCLINFCFQAAGVPMGWFDYSDVLIISHLLILVGILIISHLINKAIKEKTIDHSQSAYLISALAIIAFSGLIDMIRYYNGHSSDSAYITRFGLILFVGILAVYEFRQLVEIRMKGREAEVMHRLAMEDALTGAGSRTAFVAYEKAMLEKNSGICLFLHFDINFLKTVNDTYGHSEGDRHIIAAANVIQKSFGKKGKCFRVGGDEFFVILDGENCKTDYTNGLKKFHELQESYNSMENPPVPLVIAHGIAEYDCSSHNPEAAEQLADSRMYENKKQLKG